MSNEEIELMYPIILKNYECHRKLDDEGNTFYVNYDYIENAVPNICSNVFLGKIDVLESNGDRIIRDINAYYYILNGADGLINAFDDIINERTFLTRMPDEDDNMLEIERKNDIVTITVYDSSNNIIYKSRSLDIYELDSIISDLIEYTDEDFILDYNIEHEML